MPETAKERLMQWNLNTVILTLSLISMIAGGGWAWGDVQSTLDDHEKRLTVAETKFTEVSANSRLLDNHELRITNNERALTNSNDALRSLERTLNELSTDVKITREILQRIEKRNEVGGN